MRARTRVRATETVVPYEIVGTLRRGYPLPQNILFTTCFRKRKRMEKRERAEEDVYLR